MIDETKPLTELTDDEVLEYIQELRDRRLKRRDEQLAGKKATKSPTGPRIPRSTSKQKAEEVDKITSDLLKSLLGDL